MAFYLHILPLPCLYRIDLGDVVCKLMDLCWPACICIGLGVLEIFFLAASDASVSESNSCEFE